MKKLLQSKKLVFLSGISLTIFVFTIAGAFYISRTPGVILPGTVSDNPFPQNYKIVIPPIPANLEFAGEKAPLDITDVKERIEREFIVNTYLHSFTLLSIKRSTRFFPVIEPILKEYGIPDDFKYLAVIESGLANVISSAGATGFWQLMEYPARSNGLEVNDEIDERYHVEKSTRAACRYLLASYSIFGNWTAAAASYNMGVNGVSRQMIRQYTKNYYDLYLNEETSRYIAKIISMKTIMNNPSAYGYDLQPGDLYNPFEYKEQVISTPVSDLADLALKNGITYKDLKLLNPWLRDNKISASGKTYTLKIPVK